jgi:hypothetical protein
MLNRRLFAFLLLVSFNSMPNIVFIVTRGNLKKVGDLSFSMLNDPKAAEKHYAPEVPEVIANSFLVFPGGKHILHFRAPTTSSTHSPATE